MELAERVVKDVTVLDLSGTLTSADVIALRDRMTGLLERGVKHVVVNLGELKYLDSSGLGELVGCQLRAIKAGATLKLANVSLRIQDLLLITSLIIVFESHESVTGAIESFQHS